MQRHRIARVLSCSALALAWACGADDSKEKEDDATALEGTWTSACGTDDTTVDENTEYDKSSST